MKLEARPSPNHDPRPSGAVINMLVLHYTGMRTAEEALSRLTDPGSRVSAHYTIDREGTVFSHVPEERRAWHAGASFWARESDVNGRSIGIELVNPGHEFGYLTFPHPQIDALIGLAQEICARHPIPPSRVVGHSDVAPMRKMDPGELFPWARLAERGIGLWPSAKVSVQLEPQSDPLAFASAGLARFGYGLPPLVDFDFSFVVGAFQRHFRPAIVDFRWDRECTDILARLLGQLG